MSSFEFSEGQPAEAPQERDYGQQPLTIEEMRAVLDSPGFERAWNDPATHAGAMDALAQAEMELRAQGVSTLLDEPHPGY